MRGRLPEISMRALTDRETIVLQLVAGGLSNQEIAQQLTLSVTTVKWFLKQIYNKLGANRRTEAINRAYALGLVNLGQLNVDPSPGLPTPATPLIGRANEVADLLTLLDDPANRLVTIIGPGGMGKTHLALEVAHQYTGKQRGEVRFVALDGVQSAAGIAPAIADAIGFQLNGTLDPGKQLLAGLRKRKLLLVLDNFEHLLDAAAYVGEMMAAAPSLKIMATSRQRLNLHGETVYALHGLAFAQEADYGQDYAAFHLFLQAARRAIHTFQPNDEEVGYISQICRLVEGMPLALELAASWLDILTPAQIAHEISVSLVLLQTTMLDIPERHRSMQAVFEHSWRLLSDAERAVFMNLSVFRGGFDRAAAQAVAGAGIFVLSTLVDKSLLTRVGPDRFKLHELLRQFAEEKLHADTTEYTETIHRHCHYFGSLMQHLERNIKRDLSSVSQSLMSIDRDFDNILIGWQRTLDNAFISEIGQYTFSVTFLLESHGLYRLGGQTFGQAFQLLQRNADQISTLDCVRITYSYGWMLRGLSRYQEAERVLVTTLELIEALDDADAADAAMAFILLGWMAHVNGCSNTAKQYLQKGLIQCQKAEYAFGEWLHYIMLAEIEYDEGHFDLAYRIHRDVLLRYQQSQHIVGVLYALGFLGCTCCALGDVESARDYLRQGLAIQRDLLLQWNFQAVDPFHVTLIGIAALYECDGQHDISLELLVILLHHPQRGGDSERKARALLAQWQSHLPPEYFQSVMEDAEQGQLVSRYLDPQFTINLDLIDRLLHMIQSIEVA